MRITGKTLSATLVATTLLGATGTIAMRPAFARDIAHTLGITNCSSTSPCSGWLNTGTGSAVRGTATASDGVQGATSGTGKSGVYGETDSSAGGYGLHGANSATNGYAVYGLGRGGVGMWANATGSKPSLLSTAVGGDAADLYSTSGIGAIVADGTSASSGVSHVLSLGGKPGAIIGGVDIGAILTSGTNGTPLIVEGTSGSGGGEVTIDSTGNINTSGDIIYAGSLIGPSITRAGVSVTSYMTKTTQANVEDSGTAELAGGTAVIQLDPVYASSIDMRVPYRVFLTPDADSHGLYVAQKTATSFVVRELQGGRGSFAFDYRILGTALGHTTDRMAVITPALHAKLYPRIR